MARTVRDARLESRAARLRLEQRTEPYWRTINEGAHLGYYRGARAGKWIARFRKPGAKGGYLKKTLGEADDVSDSDGDRFLSYRHAQDLAREWFEELERDGGRRRSFTVGNALDEYLAGFGGRSLVATKSRVEAIIRPALGHLEVSVLTAKIISDWHRARANSPAKLRTSKRAAEPNVRETVGDDAVRRRRSTANRDLTVLKAALNRAADHRPELPVEAWRNVKPFKNVDGAKLRYLSEHDARRLVNATVPEFRSLVQAALLTGARYKELTGLAVRDFDEGAGTLLLRDTKAGIPRIVYLEGEGVRLLRTAALGKSTDQLLFPRPDGRRWGASQQARPLAAACKVAAIEPAGFHDLRRTYGARLALKGVPMPVIAEALGHADERITRRHYAHLSPSYVADTIRANAAGLGIVSESNVRRIA